MDRIVTKTLAEIYLQQGHLIEAIEVFKSLLERDPSDIQIKERLKKLSEQLEHSSLYINPPAHPKNEEVRVLRRWLTNIKRRKRR